MAATDARTTTLDITSSNVLLYIKADGIYDNPVRLERFGSDSSFEVDECLLAETRFGIDGGLSAGHVNSPYNVTITLEPGSDSASVMEDIAQAMAKNRKPYNVSIVAEFPSLHKQFVYYQGVMTSGTMMPNPKRLLEPTVWKFVFAQCDINNL